MKKKLIFIIPLLLCGIMFFTNYKEANAIICEDSYSKTQPEKCPYSPTYHVNSGARYMWSGNKIYIQCEFGTWKPKYTPSYWAGTDYFWLWNNKQKNI